jgi:hypothetical protein
MLVFSVYAVYRIINGIIKILLRHNYQRASANIGLAMGTGTDVAIESASVTLVKGDLRGIVKAIKLSRQCIEYD